MRVVALTSFAEPFYGYRKGREYEVEDAKAAQWIADGVVAAVQVEVAPEPVQPKRAKRVRDTSSDQ